MHSHTQLILPQCSVLHAQPVARGGVLLLYTHLHILLCRHTSMRSVLHAQPVARGGVLLLYTHVHFLLCQHTYMRSVLHAQPVACGGALLLYTHLHILLSQHTYMRSVLHAQPVACGGVLLRTVAQRWVSMAATHRGWNRAFHRCLIVGHRRGVCMYMCRIGQNHKYTVYTVYFAGIAPNLRSYTAYIYSSGQPYVCVCVRCV